MRSRASRAGRLRFVVEPIAMTIAAALMPSVGLRLLGAI